MARVTVEDCLENVENRFKLVLLASTRARQLSHGATEFLPRGKDKDTVLALRPQVQGDIVAKMQMQTAFRLFGPQEPVPMTIVDARLRVPFDLAWFTRREP